MAAKVKLGARPKTFKRPISFPMLDGTTGTIEMEYRYRTRREYGEFIDKVVADAGAAAKPMDEKFSMANLMSKTGNNTADHILLIADGWNLDEPFDREHLQQLCDELPGAATAIVDQYRAAVAEGRLGN